MTTNPAIDAAARTYYALEFKWLRESYDDAPESLRADCYDRADRIVTAYLSLAAAGQRYEVARSEGGG